MLCMIRRAVRIIIYAAHVVALSILFPRMPNNHFRLHCHFNHSLSLEIDRNNLNLSQDMLLHNRANSSP